MDKVEKYYTMFAGYRFNGKRWYVMFQDIKLLGGKSYPRKEAALIAETLNDARQLGYYAGKLDGLKDSNDQIQSYLNYVTNLKTLDK